VLRSGFLREESAGEKTVTAEDKGCLPGERQKAVQGETEQPALRMMEKLGEVLRKNEK